MNKQLFPSFKAFYDREPLAGKDYDPDGSMCQDDYEFFTGTGRYSDDAPCTKIEHEPGALEDVVGECWGRGFTDIVQRGSHTTVNGKTWLVADCTGQEFIDLCEKWERSLEKECTPNVADTEPNLELSWRERFILHWWNRRHELKIGGLQLACKFSTREWSVLFFSTVFGYPMGMGMGSGDQPF